MHFPTHICTPYFKAHTFLNWLEKKDLSKIIMLIFAIQFNYFMKKDLRNTRQV